MDFTQAAELKRYVNEKCSVVLHIHDTCGGLFLTIDEPNEYVKEFVISYCKSMGISLTVSEDGKTFFPGDLAGKESSRIWIAFEMDRLRATAYDGDTGIGVCTFSAEGQEWTIEHTYVEPSYRDRGIAEKLVEKVVTEAKARGVKIIPVCSYAREWFDEHREYKRLLKEV